jgi:hypothetical protein
MSHIDHTTSAGRVMPDGAFAQLGGGKIAYVKAVSSEDLHSLLPQAPELQPGLALWALLGADGTPILITDTREAAFANAAQNDLVTVSLH